MHRPKQRLTVIPAAIAIMVFLGSSGWLEELIPAESPLPMELREGPVKVNMDIEHSTVIGTKYVLVCFNVLKFHSISCTSK